MRSRLFRLFLAVGMCTSAALAQKQGSNETGASAFNQQIDPAFRGVWSLNVEKSKFADRPMPKMQQLNWTERGWAFAMVRADGGLYADASVIDRDCKMIGVESDYSCEVNVVTHRHVRYMFKHGPVILRSVEIKLLENGTLEMTHTVTPAPGKPYVEKMIWEREVPEQPKASSAATGVALPQQSANLMTGFTKLENEFYEAIKQKNASRLDQMLAPDYSLVTSARAGNPMDRKSWLDLIKVYDVESFAISDVVVRCLAPRVDADETCDLAAVSVVMTQTAKVSGEDRSGEGFTVDIWKRRDGKWQLFSRYSGAKGTRLPQVMQPQRP
jgi:uncharacterized protein DUF4440